MVERQSWFNVQGRDKNGESKLLTIIIIAILSVSHDHHFMSAVGFSFSFLKWRARAGHNSNLCGFEKASSQALGAQLTGAAD